MLSIEKVAKRLMWLKQSYYDQGEKCGITIGLATQEKTVRQGNQ